MVTSTPGIVKQTAHVLVALRLDRYETIDRGQLLAQEVELTQGGIDGKAFVSGQLLGGQPGAALTAEEVARRRAAFPGCAAAPPRPRS